MVRVRISDFVLQMEHSNSKMGIGLSFHIVSSTILLLYVTLEEDGCRIRFSFDRLGTITFKISLFGGV